MDFTYTESTKTPRTGGGCVYVCVGGIKNEHLEV